MDVPFGLRLLALVVVAAVLSWIDFRKHGPESNGWREYAFIFLTGFLGALLGGANDAITSAISPEYFIAGKGLPEGTFLRTAAIQYGLQVGCSGGVISGAILLYLSRRKSRTPPVPFGWLLRRLWIPILAAIAAALLLPLAASKLDPFHLAAKLQSVIPANRIPQFLLVWWIHAGLYFGLICGLLALLFLKNSRPRG